MASMLCYLDLKKIFKKYMGQRAKGVCKCTENLNYIREKKTRHAYTSKIIMVYYPLPNTIKYYL